MRDKSMRSILLASVTIAVFTMVSCGGSGSVGQPGAGPTVQPQPIPTPTPVPPTPTIEPTATPVPVATLTPTATPFSTATLTPTATPTPTPVVRGYIYDKYGFMLRLDEEKDISAIGYLESEPNLDQGILSFKYEGANVLVLWVREANATPETMLKDTYQIVRSASPNLKFVAISEGDIKVSDQNGRFGSLVATEASGAAAGGALIGAWTCTKDYTALSLTVSSSNATILQVRFDRLLQGSECKN